MSNANRAEAAGGNYRPDIDGLRAIAVAPVVLYHFGVEPFSGGFVGVDVFFVISGFLITSLIWSDLQQGRFSVVRFYERRIRRIFPALFAMLALVSAAALVILFPHTLVRYAISLLATAGFISNFQFWSEAGYWDAASVQKPLLHTWSLAVEEQFYLIFPGILYLARNASRRTVLLIIAGIFAGSLALNIWGVRAWPVSDFYLLPFRMWELMLGGMLAVGEIPSPKSGIVRESLSVLGLILIGIAVFCFSAATPFPGENALLPCVGAALIIYAAPGTRTGALLGTSPMVALGLISYSLYLYHWPIYVFARAVLPDDLNALQAFALIALSVVLAALSWRFVEQPFRRSASRMSRKTLFLLAGGAIAAAAAIGTVLWIADGFPQRYDAATRRIMAEESDHEPLRAHCFNPSLKRVTNGDLCRIGRDGVPPTFLLWGDSHADAMMPAVSQAADLKGKGGLVAAHGHCAPLLGITLPAKECNPFNDAVAKIALRKNIDTVLIDARWAPFAGEAPLKENAKGIILTDDQGESDTVEGTRAVFARGLGRTVGVLVAAGKRVIIIGPTPEFYRPLPVELAKMRVWGGSWDVAPTRAGFLARQRYVLSVFEAASHNGSVTIVRPDAVLCPGKVCATMIDGRPLYRDYSHLSLFGAQHLTPLFRGLF